MKKVLLSAFSCNPTKGSEPGNGWNWAIGLANKGFEVHCITRITEKADIESKAIPENLHFYFVELSFGLKKLYFASQATMYLYYLLWQRKAYKKAKSLNKKIKFQVAHHVTWGSLQMGSFMYKLNVPFVFGPAGGGQAASLAFKKYFKNHWQSEEKREKVSQLLLKHNPACKKMLQKAKAVLVSNPDTFKMAKINGARNLYQELDVSIPNTFFPDTFHPKKPDSGKLKLLWVGRFLPRKGILLVLEVMKELKDYPSISLTVVGDGEMRGDFLEKIEEFGLAKTVQWVGKVPFETVRNYYASHDVFFYTSLRDSGSSQLIEAMAFGLPGVTLNLHGQALINDNERGIKCDCSTPEEAIRNLKDAIVALFKNPELVEQKSKAAYAFAKRNEWENKIDRIVNKYYP